MRRMRICFADVFFCFFSVRHKNTKNTRQPFSGTAERIFMKLLPNDSGENVVSNIVPKWGLGLPNNLLGAKNWKIAKNRHRCLQFSAYNSGTEVNFWTLKMAYKVYVRPWPLTLWGKHSVRFCMYKCKNSRFLAILSKFSAVTPRQTFTVNCPHRALQVWKILWTLTHKRQRTIRLKYKKKQQTHNTRYRMTQRLFSVVRANVAWCRCRRMHNECSDGPVSHLRMSLPRIAMQTRGYCCGSCFKKAWRSECI